MFEEGIIVKPIVIDYVIDNNHISYGRRRYRIIHKIGNDYYCEIFDNRLYFIDNKRYNNNFNKYYYV